MKLITLFLIIFAVGVFARPDGSMESASDVDQNDSSASMEKMMQGQEDQGGQGEQGGQMTAPMDIKYMIEDLYETYVPGFAQTIIETINTIIPGIITGPITIPLDALHTAIMQSGIVNSMLEKNPLTTILEKIPIMGSLIPYAAEMIGVPLNVMNFVVSLISMFVSRAL
ncbi:uncharacterized protein LOC122397838 [Colletes gigas]|uniref:uncharacterized protein LOC122397838 n=1 Tax=Colletes gigas TaxID=935657 RepID=UPI001C9A55D6|nr:uncharacterized protein LOC122397838 [Colletes gigas]